MKTENNNCFGCPNCLEVSTDRGRAWNVCDKIFSLSRQLNYHKFRLCVNSNPIEQFNPPDICPLTKIERERIESGEISFSIESDYGKD